MNEIRIASGATGSIRGSNADSLLNRAFLEDGVAAFASEATQAGKARLPSAAPESFNASRLLISALIIFSLGSRLHST
ncbi:hypothetical protein [Rhodocyclus purpureus]|uniref:hypothetical protein n=1 Tax=Rhodocyclus purpureus TaxID=1067 RepID=UPI00191468E7|nr:hypothetical protein [Rhodocyclus purpureus]